MSIQVADIKVRCWCLPQPISKASKVILSLFPSTLGSGVPLFFLIPTLVSPAELARSWDRME